VREITVVAAVIRDDAGRVLISRRPEGRHMGGLWEFPGGKVDAGESPAQALVRELREELGLGVAVGAPITFAVHEEPGLRIILLFYDARVTDGVLTANEGQSHRWVAASELPRYPMPPADTELVARLAADRPP
jgi:8-oxo-dGTP diphosphatase